MTSPHIYRVIFNSRIKLGCPMCCLTKLIIVSNETTVSQREVKKASELKSKLQYVMGCEKNARDEVHRLEKEMQHQAIESNKKLLEEQKGRMEATDEAQQVISLDFFFISSSLIAKFLLNPFLNVEAI